MNNSQKVYTIYRHVNRFNGGVYIGVTSMKPERRWNNGKGYMSNKLFTDEIIFYGWTNFDHEILARTTKKEVADILEREFIKVYTTLGVSYNIQSGGYEGYTQADSTKAKMSKNHWDSSGENNPNYGKHLSAETRKKLSEANSGSNHPNYGKFGAECPNSKRVVQLDKTDGHIITIFGSIIDAQRETGIDRSNISAACKGKRNYAGGYKWRYV